MITLNNLRREKVRELLIRAYTSGWNDARSLTVDSDSFTIDIKARQGVARMLATLMPQSPNAPGTRTR